MADVIREEGARDTVVIEDREPVRESRSSTGVIVAVVILAIILLLLLFGRGMFGGGGGGGTDVNVQPQAPAAQ